MCKLSKHMPDKTKDPIDILLNEQRKKFEDVRITTGQSSDVTMGSFPLSKNCEGLNYVN